MPKGIVSAKKQRSLKTSTAFYTSFQSDWLIMAGCQMAQQYKVNENIVHLKLDLRYSSVRNARPGSTLGRAWNALNPLFKKKLIAFQLHYEAGSECLPVHHLFSIYYLTH